MGLIYSMLWSLSMVFKAILVPVNKLLHVHHILLPTHFATPPRAVKGAANVALPITDVAEEGVDAGLDGDVEAFSGSSRVTSTGSIKCTFLVNEELVPIKIERIPGHYRLFNLFFIICV